MSGRPRHTPTEETPCVEAAAADVDPELAHPRRIELAVRLGLLAVVYVPQLDLGSGANVGYEVRLGAVAALDAGPSFAATDVIELARSHGFMDAVEGEVLGRADAELRDRDLDRVFEVVVAPASWPALPSLARPDTTRRQIDFVFEFGLVRRCAGQRVVAFEEGLAVPRVLDKGARSVVPPEVRDLPVRRVRVAAHTLRSTHRDTRRSRRLAEVVDIAHRLGARVVVEGLAGPAETKLATDLGCDLACVPAIRADQVVPSMHGSPGSASLDGPRRVQVAEPSRPT